MNLFVLLKPWAVWILGFEVWPVQAGGLCTSVTVSGFAASTFDLLVGGR